MSDVRYYEERSCPECGRFEGHEEHGWFGPLRREVTPQIVTFPGPLLVGGFNPDHQVEIQAGRYALVPLGRGDT